MTIRPNRPESSGGFCETPREEGEQMRYFLALSAALAAEKFLAETSDRLTSDRIAGRSGREEISIEAKPVLPRKSRRERFGRPPMNLRRKGR